MKTCDFKQRFMLIAALAVSPLAVAQRTPQFGAVTPTSALVSPAMIRLAVPCLISVEPFDVDDYNGPFNQLVARLSQRVEKATVHVPRHRNSLKPCALSAGEKFRLFVDQQIDPINFVGAGFNAGLDQAQGSDYAYGQGARGYAQRYGAELADQATGDFFGVFLYPSIFHQDPRYYR